MTRAKWIGVFVVTMAGCTSAPAPTAPERLPLRHLAILYGKFCGSNQGRPPKDEEQFRQFMRSLTESQLASAGVSAQELDSLFVSPRDGQRYEIRYGNPPSSDSQAAIVVERLGKNGKRMVAYSMGKVEEIDEATYQQIRFTKDAP